MAKNTDRTDKAERRKRDPEATRGAILDAAEKLLIEIGPRATPMTKIAREAGVTKSLIHHHFGSKDELWTAVRRRHFERYHQVQREMLANAEIGTLELLRDSITAYFHFLKDDPSAVRFLSWRLVEAEDPNLDLEEELFELGTQRIREAQERGEIHPDLEPLAVIKSFLGMITHWFQSRGFMSDDFLSRHFGREIEIGELDEKYLNDVLHIYLEGIRPR